MHPISVRYPLGFNSTVFFYGSLYSGKSYTLEGPREKYNGVLQNATDQILEHVAANSNQTTKFMVQASISLIFKEKIYDILGKYPEKNLSLKHSRKKGTFVKGLSRHIVRVTQDIAKLLAMRRRCYGYINAPVCVCVCVWSYP